MRGSLKIVRAIKKSCFHLYIRLCRFILGTKEKAFFESFGGKFYSDNPKAISEALHKMAPSLQIVWRYNPHDVVNGSIPDYVHTVSNKFSVFREIATSSVWVNNEPFSDIPKDKRQLFIQTWHGDRGMKKCLNDSGYVHIERMCEEKPGYCDFAITGSEFGQRFFKSAFGYSGMLLKCGSPRNDILLTSHDTQSIRNALQIPDDVMVLLYAPTLRQHALVDKTQQAADTLDITKTIKLLEIKTDKKWIGLIRAHPDIRRIVIKDISDNVIDVSNWEDMADILSITDFLITDYSSSAGDFALTRKPIVLFQPDRSEYLKNDRQFYFNLDISPFAIAMNNEDIEKIITNLDYQTEEKRDEKILQFYGTYETGHAAEYVAKHIIKWISEGKKK